MILEVAQIPILEGHKEAFEVDLDTAVNAVLAHADGFLGFTGHGWGVERPQVYLFTIKWTTLEAHVEGFRASPAFAQWRALIGPHFDGTPVVEHFSA